MLTGGSRVKEWSGRTGCANFNWSGKSVNTGILWASIAPIITRIPLKVMTVPCVSGRLVCWGVLTSHVWYINEVVISPSRS
jgi:hypothetical protein